MQTTEQYLELLGLFYSYFGALEAKTNKYIGENELADYETRRKTKLLLDDIHSFNGHPSAKIEDADLPEIRNTLQAFGAMYVMEGSTLGGKIIAKMIEKQLGEAVSDSVSFFTGYGEKTEDMWAAFKTQLDKLAKEAVNEDIVLTTANDTFLKFKLWIEKQPNLN